MALINPTPIVEAVVRARTSFDGTDPSTRPRPRPPRPQWPVRQLMYNSRNNSQDSSTNEEDGTPPNIPPDNGNRDETLQLLLPLLILLTTLLLLLLIFLVFLILLRRSRRGAIALGDSTGPTNLEREDDIDGEGGLAGVEQRWLETVDDGTRTGYLRSKDWQAQYPPNSQPTDITLSQFLSIQEKGVSAWSFEPDYESNPALIVQSRTEVIFLADGVGMAPEEGGGCCVQSNLPIPKLNDVYYWECKMFEKPEATTVSIGLATKPFPSFRLPGWSKYSVGYFSSDGFKSHSFPFTSTSYGPPLTEGDVLGVGYRPRTGTVFFTRNGKKLEDAYIGLNRHNLFPTVGANGSCTLHVNFGQAGFVFIEANVKKWGLAPMMGTLAPPPAYGSERGSILLQAAGASGNGADGTGASGSHQPATSRRHTSRSRRAERTIGPTPPVEPSPTSAAGAASALGFTSPNQPIRPSPLRHSRQASNLSSRSTSDRGGGSAASVSDDEDIQNPPTPGLLDISLHSMHRFPVLEHDENEDDDGEDQSATGGGAHRGAQTRRPQGDDARPDGSDDDSETSLLSETDEDTALVTSSQALVGNLARQSGDVSPPAYHPIDPHMYAPGVAEAVLEDAFRQGTGGPIFNASGSSSPGHYEATHSGTQAGSSGFLSWLGRRGGASTPTQSSSSAPSSHFSLPPPATSSGGGSRR